MEFSVDSFTIFERDKYLIVRGIIIRAETSNKIGKDQTNRQNSLFYSFSLFSGSEKSLIGNVMLRAVPKTIPKHIMALINII